jgi:glycolate oxidase FAD binding subunit
VTAVAPARIAPASDADVASELARCNRDGAAVVAVGGATLQTLGNAPTRCDVALHLGGLRGIIDYDPRDMTAGIAAGTTLADVARTLGEHGQWIPFDAPHPGRATVGGTLAAGWAGPRRAVYGRPRDLVIGSTVALTDGSLAHAGGMVVKNVTGYDMSKIYIGSLGTLGIIVRANFKALPRPVAHRLAIAPVGDDVRDRAVGALGALTLEPAAALMIDGFRTVLPPRSGGLNLAVLFEGSEAVVDRATRDLRSALGRAGVAETRLIDGSDAERLFGDVVNVYVETLSERSITFRAPGLPSTAWARTRAVHALAAEAGLIAESIADARTGDAVVRVSSRQRGAIGAAIVAFERELRATVERVTILAGAPALRAKIDAWGPPPTTIGTMRALKARFDPSGILAPGRYVGAI